MDSMSELTVGGGIVFAETRDQQGLIKNQSSNMHTLAMSLNKMLMVEMK